MTSLLWHQSWGSVSQTEQTHSIEAILSATRQQPLCLCVCVDGKRVDFRENKAENGAHPACLLPLSMEMSNIYFLRGLADGVTNSGIKETNYLSDSLLKSWWTCSGTCLQSNRKCHRFLL